MKFYCITDFYSFKQPDLISQVLSMIRGGAKIIQYRDKNASNVDFLVNAKKMREMTKEAGVIFIINDRIDVALEVGADGIHVGQDDFSMNELEAYLKSAGLTRQVGAGTDLVGLKKNGLARERFFIIGRSTHSFSQALSAEQEGSTYISCGPIFETATKPEYPAIGLDVLKQVVKKVRIPVVAIGGIHESNIAEVLETGVSNIAMIRAITESDDVQTKIRELNRLFAYV